MDETRFYASIRAALFGGRISKAQFGGINAILKAAAEIGIDSDRRQLAYVLATAYHESARRMVPVRETLAMSDNQAIERLDAAYAAGKLPQVRLPYWRRDGDGKAWFGRGLVQLTHKRNYQLMSVVTGYNLVRRPELALDRAISVAILLRGMQEGCFTGHRLSAYFNDQTCDWLAARKIINGKDRAGDIANIAMAFFDALQQACIEPRAA